MKRAFFQHRNQFGDVARVGNQRQVRALAQRQQAQRERKDVVERQRGNVVGTAGIAQALQRRGKPGLGLQHGSHDVAVRQHRALGQPGGAAGVLQKGGAIERRLAGLERVPRALRQRIAKARQLLPASQWQHTGRHHPGQVAHRKGDPGAIGSAQQVAHRRHHHMAHGGARQHLGQRVGKVFQDDDGGGARVVELVFQLARGVERVDVDAHTAGAQHRRHGGRELRNVGQHDRHARPWLQPLRLQPGPQLGRLAVEFGIAGPALQAHRKRVGSVLLHCFFQQVRRRAVLPGFDRVRHTSGVIFQPDLVHAVSCVGWAREKPKNQQNKRTRTGQGGHTGAGVHALGKAGLRVASV